MTKLSVGQKLWLVPNNRFRAMGEVTVTKVGRQWVYLDRYDYRMPVGSLHIDGKGYSSPGQCWLSKEDHDDYVNRQVMWSSVRSFFDRKYSVPDAVTAEQLAEVARILGIELPEPQP